MEAKGGRSNDGVQLIKRNWQLNSNDLFHRESWQRARAEAEQMICPLFLVIVGGALATVRESASCIHLEALAVRGPILKSLTGVSNMDVCCDECFLAKGCSLVLLSP